MASNLEEPGAQVPASANTAFVHLWKEAAGRSPVGERFVTQVLRIATQLVDSWSSAVLPGEEKEAWEEVGADFDPEALAEATAASAIAHAELVAQSIPGDGALAEYLGVDRSRISQRLGEGTLYSFEGEDERLYPTWQFNRTRKSIRGLKAVLAALDPTLHPLVVDHWFHTPNVDLEVNEEPMSPLEWLRTGGDPEAAAALVPTT